jgi:hypothetical protein
MARRLVGDLVFEGFDVWWDFHIRAGEAFRDAIMKRLSDSDAVVGIWTKASAQSKWVRQECEQALRDNKFVPTRIKDCSVFDIPIGFREEHTVLVNDVDAIRDALIALGLEPYSGITDQMMQMIGGEISVTLEMWRIAYEFSETGISDKITDRETLLKMYSTHKDMVSSLEMLIRDKKRDHDYTLRFPVGDERIKAALTHYFIETNETIPYELCFLDWHAEETEDGVSFTRGR